MWRSTTADTKVTEIHADQNRHIKLRGWKYAITKTIKSTAIYYWLMPVATQAQARVRVRAVGGVVGEALRWGGATLPWRRPLFPGVVALAGWEELKLIPRSQVAILWLRRFGLCVSVVFLFPKSAGWVIPPPPHKQRRGRGGVPTRSLHIKR